jgi:hypothetical protein
MDDKLDQYIRTKRGHKIIPVAKCTRCIIVIVAGAAHPVSFTPSCPGKMYNHEYLRSSLQSVVA